jgi:hypothetical protein
VTGAIAAARSNRGSPRMKSIGPSFLPYSDHANASALPWINQSPAMRMGGFFNVQRWTEMACGGHFAAVEEPELLAEDISTWFRMFRDERGTEENSLDAGREFPSSIVTR